MLDENKQKYYGVDNKYNDDIFECNPIQWGRLKLYPLTMENFKEYKKYSYVFSIKQHPEYLREDLVNMPYFRMLCLCQSPYQEAEFNAQNVRSRAYDALEILKLSLKDNKDFEIFFKKVGEKIKSFILIDKIIEISEGQFSIIYKIIAAQNKIEVPDLKVNEEILKDSKIIEEQKNRIEFDEEKFLTAMNLQLKKYGFNKKEIKEMPIFSFFEYNEAIDRDINYSIYKLAELVNPYLEFKNGNPYQHWAYNTKKDNSYSTINYNDLVNKIT